MFKNFLKNIYVFGKHQIRKYHIPFLLAKEIKDGWRTLDVGCGQSSPLQSISKGKILGGLV